MTFVGVDVSKARLDCDLLERNDIGLEPGDWVSATLRYHYNYTGSEINITVRIKPNESSPPEMWMGGMLFNYSVEP